MDFTPQGLPIIDLSISDKSSLLHFLSDACTKFGCFYLKHHGIPSHLIQSTFQDLHQVFTQPLDYKKGFIDPSGNLDRGYEPFETRNVNAFMGKMGLPNDPLEKYAFGPPMENIWPDIPSTLKINVSSYYQHVLTVAQNLMVLFSTAISAPTENFFFDNCCNGDHILRVNFYPKNIQPKPKQFARFAEHTDATPFTILVMDDCSKSLQVKNEADNEWIFADPVPDALFVNLGDFMAHWTNDKWKAALHRVVWPEMEGMKDRLSLVFFLQMNPDIVVKCIPSCIGDGEKAKYEPITHKEYVNERMDRLARRY